MTLSKGFDKHADQAVAVVQSGHLDPSQFTKGQRMAIYAVAYAILLGIAVIIVGTIVTAVLHANSPAGQCESQLGPGSRQFCEHPDPAHP